jgi:hypothetical protein
LQTSFSDFLGSSPGRRAAPPAVPAARAATPAAPRARRTTRGARAPVSPPAGGLCGRAKRREAAEQAAAAPVDPAETAAVGAPCVGGARGHLPVVSSHENRRRPAATLPAAFPLALPGLRPLRAAHRHLEEPGAAALPAVRRRGAPAGTFLPAGGRRRTSAGCNRARDRAERLPSGCNSASRRAGPAACGPASAVGPAGRRRTPPRTCRWAARGRRAVEDSESCTPRGTGVQRIPHAGPVAGPHPAPTPRWLGRPGFLPRRRPPSPALLA